MFRVSLGCDGLVILTPAGFLLSVKPDGSMMVECPVDCCTSAVCLCVCDVHVVIQS